MLTNREKLSKPPEILLPCVCPSVYADKKIKKITIVSLSVLMCSNLVFCYPCESMCIGH